MNSLPLISLVYVALDHLKAILAVNHAFFWKSEPFQEAVWLHRDHNISFQLDSIDFHLIEPHFESLAAPHRNSSVINNRKHILIRLHGHKPAIKADAMQLIPCIIQYLDLIFRANCYPISAYGYALNIIPSELPGWKTLFQMFFALEDYKHGSGSNEDVLSKSKSAERPVFRLEIDPLWPAFVVMLEL